jgi:hypothetical protein
MHPRQASLLTEARTLVEKTAAKTRGGAPMLYRYTDPDNGMDFYLPEKRTTVKSPWSGKSFSAKPEKDSLSDVGKELKDDAKRAK